MSFSPSLALDNGVHWLVLERSLTDLVRANRLRPETAMAVANDPAARRVSIYALPGVDGRA